MANVAEQQGDEHIHQDKPDKNQRAIQHPGQRTLPQASEFVFDGHVLSRPDFYGFIHAGLWTFGRWTAGLWSAGLWTLDCWTLDVGLWIARCWNYAENIENQPLTQLNPRSKV